MNCEKFKIRYPEKECSLDQDEEWVTIVNQDSTEKIRLHDYEKIYEIPGLYEKIIYDKLKCDSHRVICDLLNNDAYSDRSRTPIPIDPEQRSD